VGPPPPASDGLHEAALAKKRQQQAYARELDAQVRYTFCFLKLYILFFLLLYGGLLDAQAHAQGMRRDAGNRQPPSGPATVRQTVGF
jgi:hypothetical protein